MAQTPSPRRASRPNTGALWLIRPSRSVQRNCAAEQGKEQEEASPVSLIYVRGSNDVWDAGQRETQIDNAKYDRTQPRSTGVKHPNSTSNLSGHKTPADYGAKRQGPDMLQVLPGIGVVPGQCDNAEQHCRCAKDKPPVRCCLHTENLTDISAANTDSRAPWLGIVSTPKLLCDLTRVPTPEAEITPYRRIQCRRKYSVSLGSRFSRTLVLLGASGQAGAQAEKASYPGHGSSRSVFDTPTGILKSRWRAVLLQHPFRTEPK